MTRQSMNDEQYAEKVRKWRTRIMSEMDEVFSVLEPLPEDNVLDLGCGTGAVTARLATLCGSRIVGIDVRNAMVDQARRDWRGIKFSTFNGRTIPYPDRYFDYVYVLYVLPHVEFLNLLMDDIVRVLKPGGRLVVVNPDPWHDRWLRPWHWLKGYKSDPTIRRRITKPQMFRLLKTHGLYLARERSLGVRLIDFLGFEVSYSYLMVGEQRA